MEQDPLKTLAEIFFLDKDSPSAQVRRDYLDLRLDFSDDPRKLPRSDRYLWLVHWFCNQVENGGIDQFISNETGDYVSDTLEALQAIGAVKAHRFLKLACELFPDGQPSPNFDARQAQCRELFVRYGKYIDEVIAYAKSCESEDEISKLLLEFRRRSVPEV